MINAEMAIYYGVVNLIDWAAIEGTEKDRKTVEQILEQIEEMAGIHPAEVGDANDCGECKTWSEVIDGFKELIQSGERI